MRSEAGTVRPRFAPGPAACEPWRVWFHWQLHNALVCDQFQSREEGMEMLYWANQARWWVERATNELQRAKKMAREEGI